MAQGNPSSQVHSLDVVSSSTPVLWQSGVPCSRLAQEQVMVAGTTTVTSPRSINGITNMVRPVLMRQFFAMRRDIPKRMST